MKSTEIAFIRKEGLNGIDRLLVISFSHEDALTTSAEVMQTFEAAVTEWVNTTREGRSLWNNSSGDLNIGDLDGCAYDIDLRRILNKHGIKSWGSVFVLSGSNEVSYDRVLAQPEEE